MCPGLGYHVASIEAMLLYFEEYLGCVAELEQDIFFGAFFHDREFITLT